MRQNSTAESRRTRSMRGGLQSNRSEWTSPFNAESQRRRGAEKPFALLLLSAFLREPPRSPRLRGEFFWHWSHL